VSEESPAKPLLLYDGNCGFCKIWIHYMRQKVGDRVEFAPSQERGSEFAQIAPEEFRRSVQLVRPDGSVAGGARAIFEALGHQKTYEGSRLVQGVTEAAYRVVAANRGLFYHLTRLTFGTRIEPQRYEGTQKLFLRLLAVVYAIAFASLAMQVGGLIGVNGILPAGEFLGRVASSFGAARFVAVPTIFWWGASDVTLKGVCWAGVILSVLLLVGRRQRPILVLLYLFYLSLVSAGQEFLSFQWDALLLEAGFLAIFLGRQKTVVWLFRLLVFRLFFLSGAVKLLSHDPTWHDLSALSYHFHTQPLPTVFAWFADHLPAGFLRASTWMMFAIELGAPFLIFMPRRLRHLGAWLLIGLQVLIALTGNYGFFNLLSIVLCVFLFDDQALGGAGRPRADREVRPTRDQEVRPTGRMRIATALLAALILTLGATRIFEAFTGESPEPLRSLARYTAPFDIVNGYGLFAVMTTTRPEIVMEGSNDGDNWVAYDFKFKPGDPKRAPTWAQPYMPRLDWQMWFAALSNFRENPWFGNFAVRLLQGSPEVTSLLANNPFGAGKPRYIRAQVYLYTFTDSATRRLTGAWWARESKGLYLPPVGLRPQVQPANYSPPSERNK
jgi:predicted DCC family thiol-disulfide oxidoreductase YuxK